jgi:hypothetical protein
MRSTSPRRTLAGLVLGGVAVACTSSTETAPMLAPGNATIDTTFPFVEAHSAGSTVAVGASPGPLSVVITNLDGVLPRCNLASAGTGAAKLFAIQIVLGWQGQTQALTPGTYGLGGGIAASYRVTDASCGTARYGDALQATVKIDAIEPSLIGTADMTFPSGRVIASFNAPPCPLSAAAGGGNVACSTYTACPAAGAPTSGAACLH